MTLPANHPLRLQLHEEVHARPPEPKTAPSRISYIALTYDNARKGEGWDAVYALAARYGAPLPPLGASRPVSILMVVDLPAPFGPRKP